MKTSLKNFTIQGLLTVISGFVLITSSCQRENKPAPKPAQSFDLPADVLQDTIPLEQAIDDIRRYKEFADSAFTASGLSALRAFTLNTADLLKALNITTSNTDDLHVRGYMAINKNNEFRFYLVRVVDAALKPNPHDCVAGKDEMFKYEGKMYVLDLNAPCPKTCDIESPLYTLIDPTK